MNSFRIKLAGVCLDCSCVFAETERYFRGFSGGAEEAPCGEAAVSAQAWRDLEQRNIAGSAYMEYSVLTSFVSDALLPRGRFVLHAAALRWRDMAYLICADSGVGKSTQARCLQQLRPGEFGVICGDRPILEFRPPAASLDHLPVAAVIDRHTPASVNHPPVGGGVPDAPRPAPAYPVGGGVPDAPRPAPAYPAAAVIDRHTPASPDDPPVGGSVPDAPRPAPAYPVGGGVPDAPRPAPAYPVAAVIDRHTPASPGRPQTSSILVHPSPWNGKENWHGAAAAPLAGIILLERGPENRLVSITDREAALPMYTHVIHSAEDPQGIQMAAELLTRLLRAVPLWRLSTHEVPDSTQLLLDAVFR